MKLYSPRYPTQCVLQGMIVRSCLLKQRTAQTCPLLAFPSIGIRHFQQSFHHRDDHGMPNHYETLDLPTNASPAEIKK